jgi:hypothetical protein
VNLRRLTMRTFREQLRYAPLPWNRSMSHRPAPDQTQDAALLEAAVDQAIAACGGDVREAVKALIVANDFLETEVAELMRAVSQAYVRGRFKAYNG